MADLENIVDARTAVDQCLQRMRDAYECGRLARLGHIAGKSDAFSIFEDAVRDFDAARLDLAAKDHLRTLTA